VKRDAACFKRSIGFIFKSLRASTGRRARPSRPPRSAAASHRRRSCPRACLVTSWRFEGDICGDSAESRLAAWNGRSANWRHKRFLGAGPIHDQDNENDVHTATPSQDRLQQLFWISGPKKPPDWIGPNFWLSIGGCGGRQWGWKTMHLLPPRPQFFLRKWMWAN